MYERKNLFTISNSGKQAINFADTRLWKVVTRMIGLKASVLAVITLSIYLAANNQASMQVQEVKKTVIERLQQN
ncbi:MAG: hypothetical protein K2Y22_07185 [Candidatus Obscuribacterales bacterium]|nr:hypothetical protein [Candidatus Obscuribacterales bacterium]